MKKLAILVAFLAAPAVCSAQEVRPHVVTPVPDDARYYIVQSMFAAKYTFKLDKVSGKVEMLVAADNGKLTWEEVPREAHEKDQKSGKPIYQIFMSGIAARFTFLVNTATGATWQLTQNTGPDGGYFFTPIR